MKIFSKMTGYSLIELMIALLVLSIGLLGMAGLQATSLRYGQDAHNRSASTILAYDIIERIRVNRDNAADYVTGAICAAASCACNDKLATPANDMGCWGAALHRTLPNVEGKIELTDAAQNEFMVTLRWEDREDASNKFKQEWSFIP